MVGKNRIVMLVLAAAVLAVVASGTASAATWNLQSDVSELKNSTSAKWTVYIDYRGSVADGSVVSWLNGMNHNATGVSSIVPAYYCSENMLGDGFEGNEHTYYSTLSYGQAWSVWGYTINEADSGVSSDYIKVKQRYYDANGGALLAYTPTVNQYYTIT